MPPNERRRNNDKTDAAAGAQSFTSGTRDSCGAWTKNSARHPSALIGATPTMAVRARALAAGPTAPIASARRSNWVVGELAPDTGHQR